MKKMLMNNKKSRTFFVLCFLLTIGNIYVSSGQTANFPYSPNLTNSSDITLIGDATANSSGVTLTTDELVKFGAFYLDKLQFDSSNGIEVEFVYDMTTSGTYPGDGLSFFLFDASVPFEIGSAGGGMGYLYRRADADSGGPRYPGLNGAYLGVGFDALGNFKRRIWTGPRDSFTNGIAQWSDNVELDPHFNENLTLRGAMDPNLQGLTSYDITGTIPGYPLYRFAGYPVLFSTDVTTRGKTYSLDYNSGSHFSSPQDRGSGTIDFLTGVNKRVVVTLYPRRSSEGGGFSISVKFIEGGAEKTILERFPYPELLKYPENANGSTPGSRQDKTLTLHAPVPNNFRIGFSAATGGARQKHLIRSVVVRLPYGPRMGDDSQTYCDNPNKTFYPFNNDRFYTGVINDDGTITPSYNNPSSNNVDPSTFKFVSQSGSTLGTSNSSGATYTNSDGTWKYNSSTKAVTFQRGSGFPGGSTVWVYYSVKSQNTSNGPFDQENYRSGPTKISLIPESPDCKGTGGNTARGGSINPHIPFRSYPRY